MYGLPHGRPRSPILTRSANAAGGGSEISEAAGGGNLCVRYDAEINFGDMCLECGALCGVEACTCSPPRFPSFGSSPAGRQPLSSEGQVTALDGHLRAQMIATELEDWVLLVPPKRPRS